MFYCATWQVCFFEYTEAAGWSCWTPRTIWVGLHCSWQSTPWWSVPRSPGSKWNSEIPVGSHNRMKTSVKHGQNNINADRKNGWQWMNMDGKKMKTWWNKLYVHHPRSASLPCPGWTFGLCLQWWSPKKLRIAGLGQRASSFVSLLCSIGL